MISLEIISVLIFFGIIGILAYRDRKNVEFNYGLLIRRTKKGKKIIYRLGSKHRKKLQILGNLAIVIGLIVSVYTFATLIDSSYKLFSKPEEAEQAFAMPLPKVTGVEYPGFVLGIPFWYWIIGVFFVLFAHEPMHALLARAEKVKIKSFGFLLFFLLPGAFVEPDEKQIEKLSLKKKLRIFAVGSFGNFVLAAILFLIIFLGLYPLFFRGGVIFGYLNYTKYNRPEPFPAEILNMTGVILTIDGEKIESIKDLQEVMVDKKPNQNVLIKTTDGEYDLMLTNDPKNETKGYMGVYVADYKVLADRYRGSSLASTILLGLTELLSWVFVLNLGIGAANLLPIKPLDGGLMLEGLVKHFLGKKKSEKIVLIVSLLTLSLILIALFGPSLFSLMG